MGEVPEYLKMVWAGTMTDNALGNKGLVIYQCDDAKLSEGLAFCWNDNVRYNAVPGYRCSINVWTEPEDALKMLGMI